METKERLSIKKVFAKIFNPRPTCLGDLDYRSSMYCKVDCVWANECEEELFRRSSVIIISTSRKDGSELPLRKKG